MKALRALVITETTKQEIDALVAHAALPENWYDPLDRSDGWYQRLPGNNPKHIYHIVDGYRCVFSYTKSRVPAEATFRHLSISVDGDGYPNPEAVLMIARLFGFTGDPPKDPARVMPDEWLVTLKRREEIDDPCIVVAQDIRA